MRRLLMVGVALMLAGCSHNLALMGSNGVIGTGHATGAGGRGTLEINLGGRTYTGTWVYAQGGSVGFGFAGRHSFSMMSVDTNGGGNAILHSTDGSTLRCRFTYGGSGYGECEDGEGVHYDLQIS